MTTIVKHTSSIKRDQISLASMDMFLKFMAKRGISPVRAMIVLLALAALGVASGLFAG